MFGEHGDSYAHINDIECIEKMLQAILISKFRNAAIMGKLHRLL